MVQRNPACPPHNYNRYGTWRATAWDPSADPNASGRLSVVVNNSGFNPSDYTKHLIDRRVYPGVIQCPASAGGLRVIGKLSQV
jgi:hypothetical protein